jgi:hypothetical protein
MNNSNRVNIGFNNNKMIPHIGKCELTSDALQKKEIGEKDLASLSSLLGI